MQFTDLLLAMTANSMRHGGAAKVPELQKKICRRSTVSDRKSEWFKKINPRLADVIKNIYDHSISFGAHPNVFSIDGNIVFDFPDEESVDADGQAHISIFSSGEERRLGFTAIASSYDISLHLFKALWPTKYFILGVEAAHRDACFEARRYVRKR